MHQRNLSGIDELYMGFTSATDRGGWERQFRTATMKEEQSPYESGESFLNHPGLQL